MIKLHSFFGLIAIVSQVLVPSTGHSQAALPTYYSFDQANPPTGWTEYLDVVTGNHTYSGGSDASPSCRLDGTGEYVLIEFAEQPSTLQYFIRGTGISQPANTGTEFTVQASSNGTTWTTLRTFDENNTPGSFSQYQETLQSSHKFVRFYYTNKVSGSNIALDEIQINKAIPGAEAWLSIEQSGNFIFNGSTLYILNVPNVSLTIRNEGTDSTLFINSFNFSGTNASDFSITGMPAQIIPGGSNSVTLNFNSGGLGSRFATLNITSNDPNDNPYLINIYAIAGPFATEPATQPSNLTFSNITSYTYNLSFTASTNTESYLVLRKKNSPVTEQPTDGSTYDIGDYIGSSLVAFKGNDLNLIPKDVIANQTYYYSIFAFNGPDGFENYRTNSPLSGSVSTTNALIGNYYSGINSSLSSFISSLHNLINPHTQIFYSNYSSALIEPFEERDTTDGKRVVDCRYTGYHYVYVPPFSWDSLSREHVFSHSWFPTYPATNNIEYSDLHNLYPTHLTKANIPRSNNPFGEVVTVTSSFLDGKLGLDANGNTVYEPREDMKGNVARSIFYMLTCYNTQSGINWFLPTQQDQDLLKTWHYQDLPDNNEIARNDLIHSQQGNRNPFIDSVHFACYIDFSNMTYIGNPPGWCVILNDHVLEKHNAQIDIFPNPTTGIINVHFSSLDTRTIVVRDVAGKLAAQHFSFGQDLQIDLGSLTKGIYFIEIREGDKLLATKKIILTDQ